MSGRVHVKGDASQSAGATGCGGLLVIDGNASARCGISMKGIDIVVKGSVGHMTAFMAQAGNLVVLGDAGEALGDSIYEARLYVRGTVKSLGADCIEKAMRDEHKASAAQAARRGRHRRRGRRSEFRRYGSARKLYNFHIDNAGVLLMSGDDDRWIHTPPRKSATFDDYTIAEIQPRRGDRHLRHPRRRRQAQAAAFRRSAVPRRLDRALSARGLSREMRAPTSSLGARFAKKPIELKIPITIAGMSFGSLSAQAKEALGRGATAVGTSTTTGDGGMTPEEREHSHAARLPGAALALRHEPRRSAQGRRHRGRGRPGRQAGRRRHAARPEDLRPRRRDAHPARRASTSAPPAAIPTGPGPTISRSRSRSCARSPTGRSRSTSRSAPRGPTTTPRSR